MYMQTDEAINDNQVSNRRLCVHALIADEDLHIKCPYICLRCSTTHPPTYNLHSKQAYFYVLTTYIAEAENKLNLGIYFGIQTCNLSSNLSSNLNACVTI